MQQSQTIPLLGRKSQAFTRELHKDGLDDQRYGQCCLRRLTQRFRRPHRATGEMHEPRALIALPMSGGALGKTNS